MPDDLEDVSRLPWTPFSPDAVRDLLGSACDPPWWLAGGYALELFAGRSWRRHADVDVLVLRPHQHAIHRWLPGWEVYAADPPGRLRLWEPNDWLPRHVHDVWCRETTKGPWRIQFMIDEADGDHWVSRRDHRITRPLAQLGHTSESQIPYLAPEVQLFYKAQETRPKDEQDFLMVAPLLGDEQRHWLRHALDSTLPQHPWIDRLDP